MNRTVLVLWITSLALTMLTCTNTAGHREANNPMGKQLLESIDYLGQPAPGKTPVLFAPGLISGTAQEHGAPSFSPDGSEVFWQSNTQPEGEWVCSFMTMSKTSGRWGNPHPAPFGGNPVFSADGNTIYFELEQPACNARAEGPYYAEKTATGWSEPRSLELVKQYPEVQFTYGLSRAANGTLYFMGKAAGSGLQNSMGIYRSEPKNGGYLKPELLPSSINKPGKFNWTPFVAPDESFLIFATNFGTSSADFDLYISFKQQAGGWTDAVSLGETINTNRQEKFPKVSPEGKHLFFTRDNPPNSDDVFWVSAAIIDELKAAALPRD